jgi:hypothetical protein
MPKLLDPEKVKTAATSAVGDVAGAVADPKAGSARLRSRLSSPRVLATAAGLALAYLAGRRAGSRGGHR